MGGLFGGHGSLRHRRASKEKFQPQSHFRDFLLNVYDEKPKKTLPRKLKGPRVKFHMDWPQAFGEKQEFINHDQPPLKRNLNYRMVIRYRYKKLKRKGGKSSSRDIIALNISQSFRKR